MDRGCTSGIWPTRVRLSQTHPPIQVVCCADGILNDKKRKAWERDQLNQISHNKGWNSIRSRIDGDRIGCFFPQVE